MRVMRAAFALALMALLAAMPLPLGARQRDALDPVLLQRVRAYAVQYIAAMSSVVARESYEQHMSARRERPQTRTLVSDVLVLRPAPDALAVWFRDVLEVDGRRVGDREARLLTLLEHRTPDTLQDAQRIAAESARYNLGTVRRTINVPDLVFAYVVAPAAHVEWRAARNDRIAGQPVQVLRFREVGQPTAVRTPQGRDSPATGRVWVHPETGAVVKAEVYLGDMSGNATTTVAFAADPRLPVLVPKKMDETYKTPGEIVYGTATYSDVRVFGVTTSEQLRKPPPAIAPH